MNRIRILEPRWKDRTLLIADWKIGADNQIVVENKNYPQPFYASGEKLKTYPIQMIQTKSGSNAPMRIVPLAELSTDLVLDEL